MALEGKSSEELYNDADKLRESGDKYTKIGVGGAISATAVEYSDEVFDFVTYSTNELPELYSSAGPAAQAALGGVGLAGVGLGIIRKLQGEKRETQAAQRENAEMISEALEPDEE